MAGRRKYSPCGYRRKRYVGVYCSEAEYQALFTLAESHGLSVGAYLVGCGLGQIDCSDKSRVFTSAGFDESQVSLFDEV